MQLAWYARGGGAGWARIAAVPAGAIVLLHGIYGSGPGWPRAWADAVETRTGRPVVAVDLRHHGASPHTEADGRPAPMTFAAMADDIVAAVRAQSSPRPIDIVGHSMVRVPPPRS